MTVSTDLYQIGDSMTPSQNFTLAAPRDGTLRVYRGNYGSPLVELLRIDAEGRLSTPSGGELAMTGDFSLKQRKAAPPGWIVGDGSTIGNVGSGAVRANVDTLALFTLWWTDFSDATLPILTSAGGASPRGASAAADWAAGKRLTVFDARDQVPRIAGASFAVGSKYASTSQNHKHRTAMGADNGLAYTWLDASNGPAFGGEVVGGARSFNMSGTLSPGGGIRVAYTDTMRDVTGESAPNTIAMLGCYKL